MLHKPLFSHQQQGQVMVEYAIILILSITLLIGGIELAATAFASSKTSDGAKAGANEFVEVNEKRLLAQKNQRDYLKSLEYLLLRPPTTPPTPPDLVPFTGIEINPLDPPAPPNAIYIFQVASTVNVGFVKLASGTHHYENFVDFLDSQEDKNSDGALDADEDGDDDVDSDDYEAMFNLLVDGATIDVNNPRLNLGVLDADADGEVTDEELEDVKKLVLNYSVDAVNTAVGTPVDEKLIARVNRYKALIILEQLTLSRLPLNTIDFATATAAGIDPIPLSEAKPLIGDHNGNFMTNPSCGAGNTYNTGLPNNDNDPQGIPDTEWPVGSGIYLPAVYLFNPRPINVASCTGPNPNDSIDLTRGNRSKVSILVGGFGTEDEANYVKGLPKLNQAMYGEYVNVCLDGANQYVRCSGATVAQTLLKPPGKLCLTNAVSPTVDSCSVDAPAIGTTGYYFWGSDNDTPNAFSYANDQLWFRPTFQLVCNPDVEAEDTHQSPLIVTPACTNGEVELSTIQINTRYRSVFESFLTFGLLELADANLAQFFFDPSNLRSLGAGLGVGIAGSELGSKRQNGNPTVKPFKDFRGCYEVNVETNQVSACK